MQVSYNGVVMQVVHTLECTRAPVWSDDGTELLSMRCRYRFSMLLNPSATSYNPGGQAPGEPAAVTDRAIRYALMEPRKQLTITADDAAGTVVLQSPAAGLAVDVNNGPKPTGCVVKSITPRTWSVTWGVTTEVIECGEFSQGTTPIISNRFTQSQQTGIDRRTTVVTRGVTTFRTDQLARVGRNADFFRSQVIPGLPLSFQRQAIQVSLNSAGNVLAWEVVDQEQFVSIGGTDDPRRKGVVRFTAVFSTKSSPLDANNVPTNYLLCQFDATAWGDATSSRAGMIEWLARLAVERSAIPRGPVDPDTQAMILSVSTSEALHEPTVSIHVTLQLPPAKAGKVGLGTLRTDFIGVDDIRSFANNGESPQMPNDGNTRGTANTEAFAAAIKDACSSVPKPPARAGDTVGYPDDNVLESTPTVTVRVVDDLESTYTRYSSDATDSGTYTEMRVETRIRTDRGRVAAPVSGYPGSPGDGTDGGGTGGTGDSGDTGRDPLYPGGPGAPGGGAGGGTPAYGFDDGTSPTGVSGGGRDDDDVVILQVSRPRTTVEIVFEAERCSRPPRIPHPDLADRNLVLMSDELTPMAVGVAPDGQTPVYRIGGKYTYVARKARAVNEALSFGVHPFTDFGYDAPGTQLAPSDFVHGIVDSDSGPSY